MPAPSNRVPVRLGRGNKIELDTNLVSIQEGECVYARDEDALYVKDAGVLVNVAQGSGAQYGTKSGEVVFTIGAYNGTTGYLFNGDGFGGNEINPPIYLVRSKQYRWVNPLQAHGITFYSDESGEIPYVKGIQNAGAISGDNDNSTIFVVPQDAPSVLYYRASDAASMRGTLLIVGNEISGDLDDLDDVEATNPVNGMTILYSAATGKWEAANLASGGAVDLASLTDVDLENSQDKQVLMYNEALGQWINSDPTPGVNDPQRSTSVVIGRSSKVGMHGGNTPLRTNAEIDAKFERMLIPNFPVRFDDEPGRVIITNFPPTIATGYWLPLNRSDLVFPGDIWIHSDGRIAFGDLFYTQVIRDQNNIYNCFGSNASMGFAPFVGDDNYVLENGGTAESVFYEDGKPYTVIRLEYHDGVTGYLPVELWIEETSQDLSKIGTNMFMMIGTPEGGFTIPIGYQKNGIVFGGSGQDPSAYAIADGLPGLGPGGDYCVQLFYQGTGYMLDKVLDVDLSTLPQRDGELLKWSTTANRWVPGNPSGIGAKTPNSPGRPGEISTDGTFMYICTSLDVWKRVAIVDFT